MVVSIRGHTGRQEGIIGFWIWLLVWGTELLIKPWGEIRESYMEERGTLLNECIIDLNVVKVFDSICHDIGLCNVPC